MKEAGNSNGPQDPNLWFVIQFDHPLNGKQRKIYEGFCEGWVAYHDIYVDKVSLDNGDPMHKVEIKWVNSDKTAEVYLYPLLHATNLELTSKLTYSTPAQALSDPPVPIPPPPPSGL